MQKDKSKRIKWMFAIGLTGCASSLYAKYVNTEIDVVFQDNELMQSIVPKVPALYRVSVCMTAAVQSDRLPAVQIHGDNLLLYLRTEVVRAREGREHSHATR